MAAQWIYGRLYLTPMFGYGSPSLTNLIIAVFVDAKQARAIGKWETHSLNPQPLLAAMDIVGQEGWIIEFVEGANWGDGARAIDSIGWLDAATRDIREERTHAYRPEIYHLRKPLDLYR
jgi:hypothetical protein